MKIEYNSVGDVYLLNNGHRSVLHPNRMAGTEAEPIEITESDVSGEASIVQSVFNAMKAVPTEGNHRLITFDTTDAVVKVGGEALTPDSDVSGYGIEVQTFFNTIYGNDAVMKLYNAKQTLNPTGDIDG